MNSIKITGRMVADPELKRTQNDTAVCSFNVAVDRIYSKEKETDFFTVVAWRQTAEFVAKYFAKGRKILVEGEMQSRKYTDKEGNNRTAWEIKADRVEFCDSKGQTDGGSDDTSSNKSASRKSSKNPPPPPTADDNGDEDGDGDDLPF